MDLRNARDSAYPVRSRAAHYEGNKVEGPQGREPHLPPQEVH